MGKQKIILSELFDAAEVAPKENGDYIIFSVFQGRVINTLFLSYTTAFGWNTTLEGENRSPIIFKKSDTLHLWCKAQYEKGDKK